MDVVTLELAKGHTNESLNGLGALKGANCTIKSIVPILDATGKEIANEITFEWTGNDGKVQTSTIAVKNGTDAQGTIVEVEQTALSATWTIQHNLATEWYNLSITCLDDDSNIVIGEIDVSNTTDNLLVIKFNEPITGKIIVKK